MNRPSRVGQVWQNAAGLVVLVVSSSADGSTHKLIVLDGAYIETGLRPGAEHTWTEESTPWEAGPSWRIA